MGLIHTPRTLASISRGLWNRWRSPSTAIAGMGKDNPHCYRARMSVWDVDYMGHMNNGTNDIVAVLVSHHRVCDDTIAAYLSHAEYARWQMSAENGLIQAMANSGTHFVVVGSAIRYRKELRPVFSKFTVESTVCGLDDRIIWIEQNFKSTTSPRIAAQVLVQGAAVRKGKIINPVAFFKEEVLLEDYLVDSIVLSNENETVNERLRSYKALDEAMKASASDDDRRYNSSSSRPP